MCAGLYGHPVALWDSTLTWTSLFKVCNSDLLAEGREFDAQSTRVISVIFLRKVLNDRFLNGFRWLLTMVTLHSTESRNQARRRRKIHQKKILLVLKINGVCFYIYGSI